MKLKQRVILNPEVRYFNEGEISTESSLIICGIVQWFTLRIVSVFFLSQAFLPVRLVHKFKFRLEITRFDFFMFILLSRGSDGDAMHIGQIQTRFAELTS